MTTHLRILIAATFIAAIHAPQSAFSYLAENFTACEECPIPLSHWFGNWFTSDRSIQIEISQFAEVPAAIDRNAKDATAKNPNAKDPTLVKVKMTRVRDHKVLASGLARIITAPQRQDERLVAKLELFDGRLVEIELMPVKQNSCERTLTPTREPVMLGDLLATSKE